jgi:ACS family D-galactonate transporter-like MFS transporter
LSSPSSASLTSRRACRVSDIAPKELLGLSGGLFNLFANAAGIVTPLVIGLIVSATGSFVFALALISLVTLIGALTYIFVVGDLERIEIRLPSTTHDVAAA